MKKKLSVFTLLLVFALFSAGAYGKYGGFTTSYYYGDGWAGAKYCGTTKSLTIAEVHNDRWMDTYEGFKRNENSSPQSFSGKLSKRQSRLLWDALSQYDYAAGEIYAVGFSEEGSPKHRFALSVQIEADGSCTWQGFTYDEL